MSKLMSLFDSQQQAYKALESLHKTEMGKVDITVIENEEEIVNDGIPQPLPANPMAARPIPSVLPFERRINDLGIGDEATEFFVRGVKHGATLVIVEVEEAQQRQVEEIFRREEGRIHQI